MKLFVSYRRDDTRHISARLVDRLEDHPDIQDVFLDVDDIFPGENFEARINNALNETDACLVVIGKDWVGSSVNNGKARITDKADYVRREVAAALASKRKVIPVLVDDASMPPSDTLPDDIRFITKINALFIRHESFNQDLELLKDAVFSRRAPTPVSRFLRRRPIFTLFAKALLGILVAIALTVALGVIHQTLTGGRSLDETLGSEGLVWLLIGAAVVSGAAIPVWFSIRR